MVNGSIHSRIAIKDGYVRTMRRIHTRARCPKKVESVLNLFVPFGPFSPFDISSCPIFLILFNNFTRPVSFGGLQDQGILSDGGKQLMGCCETRDLHLRYIAALSINAKKTLFEVDSRTRFAMNT